MNDLYPLFWLVASVAGSGRICKKPQMELVTTGAATLWTEIAAFSWYSGRLF